MLRIMYLPDDAHARVITVEEIMHYNLGADSWPTAEVVVLQLHAIPGASMNWTQLLVSPGSFEAGGWVSVGFLFWRAVGKLKKCCFLRCL